MLKFYLDGSPGSVAVALFLEEAGLAYEPVAVDRLRGDELGTFLALNPYGKAPMIVDDGATVFGSAAILLYLADKTGKFLPQKTLAGRAELLSWLMAAAAGVAPFSSQSLHADEVERQLSILDARLKNRRYLVSYSYTIGDMSLWASSRMLGDNVWAKVPHLKRHCSDVGKRPAAARALALGERHPQVA